MVVLRVENAKQDLRGDLTKWLIEIDSGFYVGELNARVREKLWERVCKFIRGGNAIMVYSTDTEQGYDFKVYGRGAWEPINFDGLKLILRPNSKRLISRELNSYQQGASKASNYLKARRGNKARLEKQRDSQFSPKDF
ncbi:MAG: type I-E CRISPR-associated endoribonuclease Cas2e [Oscillospiraceae bacterium]|jgi:CRISPR-associated protein Cas2|nr:type I-E CRISPR-associated endoribonuclease Cas2e [Oscillospiraceae bacterium]